MNVTAKIASLENRLAKLREQAKVCKDPEEYNSLQERIDYIQDDIDELEESIQDQEAWEEITGTSPQDLYNERNSYAIRQSEMIDRFRNEI